ncbi:efflux RND transporter periplasmic adaptor subunit [Parasphingopyxis algicola]|uniref:efflux RND transporter periplasmic adaptor subunit n=1 Tax=Parasphingopyxis algicola TaxID=2026624 RepID=UPI001FE9C2EF|nr:efflux RND transporter periplasmic adaptor subunit [Parasphingopyxis algicola]
MIGAVILALAAVTYVVGSFSRTAAEVDSATSVAVVTVRQQQGYAIGENYVGRVEARRESELGFELGGRIANILVDDGDEFRRGQPLAALDTQRLRARRAELVGRLSQARADLALASATADRTQRLFDAVSGAVSQQQLDEARFTRGARAASVQAIVAQIGAVDVDIAKSVIRAPFDGIVVLRHSDEGEVVATGPAVLSVVEREAPQARIGVSGAALQQLTPGELYSLSVDGRRFEATLESLAPARSARTRTVDALFTLPAEIGEIRSGDLATLALESDESETGFWLPLSALTESRRGLWAAYAAVTNNQGTMRAVRRELELLHQSDGRAFVRGTIRDGDRIVVEGVHRLTPNAEIMIVGPDAGDS